MRKPKIYLDTSVISHLSAPDAPDKMNDTLALWEEIKAGKYNAVLSSVTLRELENCDEPKRGTLFDYLRQIQFDTVAVDAQTIEIAEKFIDFGILKQKSFDDCQHIAAAIVSGCDIIVSWNFKHIVNYRTIQGVKAVTALSGFPEILIYPPPVLLGGDYSDT